MPLCNDPGGGFSSILPVAILGLLRWSFPPSTVDLTTDVVKPALLEGGVSCQASPSMNIELSCSSEVNIFTNGAPDQIITMIALFNKATEVSKTQNCQPAQYPIKSVVGSGGYDQSTWYLMIRMILLDLQADGVVPDKSYFDVETQHLKGPTARDVDNPRYRDYPGAFNAIWSEAYQYGIEGNLLLSIRDSLPTTMDMLIRQKAPIIVALRPILEFPVLWTEYILDSKADYLNISWAYDDFRRGMQSRYKMDWPDATENFKKSIQALERSRIIMYQGKRNFWEMSAFFFMGIMDTQNSPEAVQKVKDLEEAFVNLPLQFLLVDREAMMSNVDYKARRLFTAGSQPRFYGIFKTYTNIFSKFLEYINRYNKPRAAKREGDFLSELLLLPPQVFMGLEKEWRTVLAMAPGISESMVLGNPFQDQLADFWSKLRTLEQKVTAAFQKRFGGIGLGLPIIVTRGKRALNGWAAEALYERSWIEVSNILLPFVFEPTGNLVRESFQRVKYAGWDQKRDQTDEDRSRDYTWPATDDASSNIWFTRARSGGSVDDAEAKQLRMQREIEALYTNAAARND